jgi:hypothetical protein
MISTGLRSSGVINKEIAHTRNMGVSDKPVFRVLAQRCKALPVSWLSLF